MRLTTLLTAGLLGLTLTGCGKSGSDSNGGTAATSAGGSYQANFKTAAGDGYVLGFDIAAGSADMRTYYFKNANMATGTFQKGVGTYVQSGTNYTVTYSYKTCNHVPSDVYTVATLDDSTISVSVSGKVIVFHKVASLDKFLADEGMIAAVEDTNCNIIPN